MAKFKVGDKVRAKVGGQVREGVIKEIDSNTKPYLVYFDGWTGGHNGNDWCTGKYEGNHCWWFEESDLSLKENSNCPLSEIKRYIINENATIIFWEDGEKTIVKRCSDEPFKKELGFLYAYFQKTSGLSKTKANKFIKELKVTKPKEKKKKKKDNSQLEENIKFFQEVTDVVPEITRESKFNLGDIVNVRYEKNKLNYSEIKEIYGNGGIEVYRDKRTNRVQIRYKVYAKKFYNGEWTYIIQSRTGKKKYFALKETALRRVYA